MMRQQVQQEISSRIFASLKQHRFTGDKPEVHIIEDHGICMGVRIDVGDYHIMQPPLDSEWSTDWINRYAADAVSTMVAEGYGRPISSD